MVVLRRSARLAVASSIAGAQKRSITDICDPTASKKSKPAAREKASSSKELPEPSKWKHGTLDRGMENKLYGKGFKFVVGVDEAGRGPLAGPVVAVSGDGLRSFHPLVHIH